MNTNAPAGFGFAETKTCVIVGAGASVPLSYPLLAGEKARGICDAALKKANTDEQHRSRCRGLLYYHVGPRFGWDLERMCEHLAHIPASMYPTPLDCNTGHIRQWIIEEIDNVMKTAPAGEHLLATKGYWQTLLQQPRPIAVFTTNYDGVIEECLDGIGYADGWKDKEYNRERFGAGQAVEVALVKLHGTAGRKHSWHYTTRRVGGTADPVTQRPALIEPSRYKTAEVEPFSSTYDFLGQALSEASDLLIIGFSWRDRSVADALRSALLRRHNRPLNISVYGRHPFVVEERVRDFLRASGVGTLLPALRWRHAVCELPDLVIGEAVCARSLDAPVTLEPGETWAHISGEPQMLDEVAGGAVTIHWDDEPIYFESGRLVLRHILPDRFRIELSMVMRQYGSGWDPGISLEDDKGEDIFYARFINEGKVWQHECEVPEAGLRLGSGNRVFCRLPVPPNVSVKLVIEGEATGLRYGVETGQSSLAPTELSLGEGHAARRLHVGGYPWYSDLGLAGYGRATRCDIGPCTITPLG